MSGYLTRLEYDYGIITKELPVGAKALSKNAVYAIRDNFFTFWFRFIFKYTHIIEIGAYEQLRTLIKRDFATFSGRALEKYFKDKLKDSKRYTLIGRWWDRKGEYEIDMIAANELEKTVEIYEIKRNRKNIDFSALQEKTDKLMSSANLFTGYDVTLKGADMYDM